MIKLESAKRVYEFWKDDIARIFIEIYDDTPDECVFTHLWVDETWRNKGYGKEVISEAEKEASKLGCKNIYLKVETDSWIHQWYVRHGYSNLSIDTEEPEFIWMIKSCKEI